MRAANSIVVEQHELTDLRSQHPGSTDDAAGAALRESNTSATRFSGGYFQIMTWFG